MELLSTGALRWGGLTPLARRGAERRAIGALASVLDCCCGKADGRSHECACEGNDCSFDGRDIAMLGWCVRGGSVTNCRRDPRVLDASK